MIKRPTMMCLAYWKNRQEKKRPRDMESGKVAIFTFVKVSHFTAEFFESVDSTCPV